MGMSKRPGAALLLLLLQIAGGLAEWHFCMVEFTDSNYQFSVPKSLKAGTVVGQVVFQKCAGPRILHYVSEDPDFEVQANGSVAVKNPTQVHRHRTFHVSAVEGGKFLSETTVTLKKKHSHHSKGEKKHHASSEHGRKRQKRDWVIPPFSVSENGRGPYPKPLMQVKSSKDKEVTVYYAITGQGADTPPVGLFTIDRTTGWLSVTAPLDRENIANYILFVHATSSSGAQVENPIDIDVRVVDQNDNHPKFTQECFFGSVPEGSKPGTPVMNVTAEDADDSVNTNNGIVWYYITAQDPDPNKMMFTINPVTGLISVIETGLDRETCSVYTLTLQAIDQEGAGYTTTGKAVITVTDTNDNPPIFDPNTYTAVVPENVKGFEVALLTVTDRDEPNTDAWYAVYQISKGNEAKLFSISTTNDNMGLLTTAVGLDFETKREYILTVVVTNKANFSVSLPVSSASVKVTVEDVNEPPEFNPPVKKVSVPENEPIGQDVTSYTAQDPDKAQNQMITYRIGYDPAGWLAVNPENGIITGNGQLDRESMFVKNNTYKAIILAVDNGVPTATGTGTLELVITDVNDNGPFLEYSNIVFCQKAPNPISIPIIDRDQPPNTAPYIGELGRDARENWTATVTTDQFEIKMNKEMDIGTYTVPVTLADSQFLKNTTVLKVQVCDCQGDATDCQDREAIAGGMGIPVILGILGGILALLILVLLLLLFLRGKKVVKEPLLPPEDDTRDNVYCYDEEGGGEEDQNFDLSQLHRGLDARQDVTRNDVAPTLMPAPQYRPRPANPDEIGNFIEENLNAADNDPTAPPYDSLLVFDYEGSGSDAASLSSLNSSNSDADQDYSGLQAWGPRFNKLADMYGGDED
ncbi:cadherin-1-like [Pseudophryne corroboree]|uniref:cadherin-1-like n=1 Tax=Pseudophryne corroboree TaxID=495146 RepID=UPI0030821D1B